jgi:hypothetical protein
LKITSLLILLGLFFACNHTDKRIIKYVQSICPNGSDTCRIDLREVLKVDYDRMYLFGEFTQSDEISSVIGVVYKRNKTIADSEWRIILLKNNKIVYEDDFPTRFMSFEEITEKVDTIHKNTPYLVHYSPYYLVSRAFSEYQNKYYLLREISDHTQYRRTEYDWAKGYTFEEVTK